MYLLNEDHKMFIEQVRRMVKEKVEPRAAEIDAKAEFPWDIKEIFQEMGLLGLSRARGVRRMQPGSHLHLSGRGRDRQGLRQLLPHRPGPGAGLGADSHRRQ